MKKILTSIVVVFAVFQLKAQNGNVIFFSEDGYPFKIVMNGVMQNEKAQTNIKVPNLTPGPYKIKVIFDDAELGAIDDKVYVRESTEQTYSIKKVKISDTEKGLKSFGQNAKDFMKTKEEAEANQEKVKAKTEKWTIKMISANPLAISNASSPAPQSRPTSAAPATQSQVQNTTTTTTTTTNGVPNNNSNVNVGMNIDGVGFGMNVNVNETDANVQQQTTTTQSTQTTTVKPAKGGINMNVNVNGGAVNSSTHTTTTQTTTTTAAPAQQVYVIPGYSGPYGCGYPMSNQEFDDAKRSISSKSFEDSKFTIAKQICTKKCLLTSQVKEIMLLFTFEQTRLDFAKFAYSYTYDTGNYYKVNDAFTFETSIDDLNAYIGGR